MINCTLFCQIPLQIWNLTFPTKDVCINCIPKKLFRKEEQDQTVKEIELIDIYQIFVIVHIPEL